MDEKIFEKIKRVRDCLGEVEWIGIIRFCPPEGDRDRVLASFGHCDFHTLRIMLWSSFFIVIKTILISLLIDKQTSSINVNA